MTTVEEPFSYSNQSAHGLARPLDLPKLPRGPRPGRGPTLPHEFVTRLREKIRLDPSTNDPRWPAYAAALDLVRVLRELEGAPLWRVDATRRCKLLLGAEALGVLAPGDWRAMSVAKYARLLARRPEQVLHITSRVNPIQLPAGRTRPCCLCGEENQVTWTTTWCCPRRAQRRVGGVRCAGAASSTSTCDGEAKGAGAGLRILRPRAASLALRRAVKHPLRH